MKIARALSLIEYNPCIQVATDLAIEIQVYCRGNVGYTFSDGSVLDDKNGEITFKN
jgi:hypothetical protein